MEFTSSRVVFCFLCLLRHPWCHVYVYTIQQNKSTINKYDRVTQCYRDQRAHEPSQSRADPFTCSGLTGFPSNDWAPLILPSVDMPQHLNRPNLSRFLCTFPRDPGFRVLFFPFDLPTPFLPFDLPTPFFPFDLDFDLDFDFVRGAIYLLFFKQKNKI